MSRYGFLISKNETGKRFGDLFTLGLQNIFNDLNIKGRVDFVQDNNGGGYFFDTEKLPITQEELGLSDVNKEVKDS